MKTLTITVENAVSYHDPSSDAASVPTEHTIPEVSADFVLFQVKNSDGRILLQLPIINYFELIGMLDGKPVIDELRNIRPLPKFSPHSPTSMNNDDRPAGNRI